MNKKGTFKLGDLLTIGIVFVASIIAISIGSQILAQVGEGQCSSGYTWNATTDTCINSTGGYASGAGMSYAANATHSGLDGMNELGSWIPTLAIVVAAALVITTLVGAFYIGRR